MARTVGFEGGRSWIFTWLRTDPRVDWAGLATSLANERAIRAYEKAGFRRFREFRDPEIGPALYLVVDLRPGGGGAKT